MADAAVGADRGGCVTIVIENHSDVPMQSKKGMSLGALDLPMRLNSRRLKDL